MGVSAGGGIVHCVLLTTDEVGRSILDTRVIDVDPTDGLDSSDRVNAGIDLILTAAREAGRRVGPIGVATRSSAGRGGGLRGSGPRRQITLVDDDAAVVEYLTASGEIARFASVVIIDCGDTGMSLYIVDPHSRSISHPQRSTAISGRELDALLAAKVLADKSGDDVARTRSRRSAVLSACRTAKEELSGAAPTASVSIPSPDGTTRRTLTAHTVDETADELVAGAGTAVEDYVRQNFSDSSWPGALVLVGGLANLPAVRGMVVAAADSLSSDEATVEVVTPAAPQLISAAGAALMARHADHERLSFIGGSRRRVSLSAAPLAVVGAILAAALMTVYAVGSSLTGNHSPAPTSTSSSTTTILATTADSPVTTTTPTAALVEPTVPQQIPPNTGPAFGAPPERTEPRWDDGPGWATTALPKITPSTTTRTLTPYPMPTLPWQNGPSRPPLPTDLIPPELLPQDPRTPAPPYLAPTSQPPRTPSATATPSAPAPSPALPPAVTTTSPAG